MTSRWLRWPALALAVFMLVSMAGCPRHNGDPQRFDALWNAYAKQFLSPDGRVVEHTMDDKRSTSESQSYALFFALVANDRKRFAKILKWTDDNLAQSELGDRLPAWLWAHRKDGTWGVVDANTASDGDVWIAYTLVQAGRLWNEPAYSRMGRKLATHIAATEVRYLGASGPMLIPGANGFGPDDEGCYTLNPSYLPLPLITGLGHALGQPWTGMAQAVPNFVAGSSQHGFAPDWAGWCPQSGFGLDASKGPKGSYDAIRVYLWAGITPTSMSGSAALKAALGGMDHYLVDHDVPPRSVDISTAMGSSDGPIGFSAALLPYLQKRDQVEALNRQRKRVAAARTDVGLYGNPPGYFDQNLTMFAVGYMSRAYWFDRHGQLEVHWQ